MVCHVVSEELEALLGLSLKVLGTKVSQASKRTSSPSSSYPVSQHLWLIILLEPFAPLPLASGCCLRSCPVACNSSPLPTSPTLKSSTREHSTLEGTEESLGTQGSHTKLSHKFISVSKRVRTPRSTGRHTGSDTLGMHVGSL